MTESDRTLAEARIAFQSCKSHDPQDQVHFYNSWGENYEKDHNLMSYRAPHLAVNFLCEHLCGSPREALVLDVACGSGWVAKLMAELGFRLFVGVDGSKGMLELAADTGLYQDLRLALLGTQPLPAQPALFDVVIIVGALDVGFIPVSVIRELCQAARPGGYICMARGDHTGPASAGYKEDLEREFQLMEQEGLWSLAGVKLTDKYMKEPPQISGGSDQHISGTVYLYKKAA